MAFAVTEHVAQSARHSTFYLACGPVDGPPMIFVHGWPELSSSWRHQLPCFGALGFRAIAPDMRGYGGSSVYPRHEDYALEHAVADMLELLQSLGRERAVWVGHDWGSPVVWSLASHHPEPARRWPICACRTSPRASARRSSCPTSTAACTPRPSTRWDSGTTSTTTKRASTPPRAPWRPTCAPPCGRCSARATRRCAASRRGCRPRGATAAGSAASAARPTCRSIST